ncbi:MAG: adenylate kinase [Deltaproteobacteria bacterium]|nr:adenylate kinase [Deltaproteobacteria bacterium]
MILRSIGLLVLSAALVGGCSQRVSSQAPADQPKAPVKSLNQLSLLIIGPPGAGKGTQAENLVKALSLEHLSTGDLLRDEVKKDTEIGRQVGPIMTAGGLVPHEIVDQLLEKRLATISTTQGILFDGYPRTVVNLKSLDEILPKSGRTIDAAVLISLSEDEAIERLSGRRVCPHCHASYHVKNNPPKAENICDKCEHDLTQRPDDNPTTIHNRFEEYREQTQPVVDALATRGLLITIAGKEGTPAKIGHRVLEQLKKRFPNYSLVRD